MGCSEEKCKKENSKPTMEPVKMQEYTVFSPFLDLISLLKSVLHLFQLP